ncbi:hypothetical protein HRbin06_00875 [archaeon HR06]|nr:hypothetical protein HRbin06_00875 [archaeon HR06]
MASVEDFALSIVNEVLKEDDNDAKESFKARSKDIYSMSYFSGIRPALAFAYSKAGEENIKNLLKGSKVYIKKVDKGYALYAYAIVKYLKEIEGYRDLSGKIDEVLKIIENDEVRLTSKILNFMNWLKLFSEAKIKTKE